MSKKKQKTKIIYREKNQSFNEEKARKELSELQEKRKEAKEQLEKEKQGKSKFGRFLSSVASLPQRAAINKAISEKRRSIGIQAKTQQIRQQVGYLKERTDLEKARQELRKAQQKNQVDFESLNTIKPVKYEDLFK